jgi:hypothetical protein
LYVVNRFVRSVGADVDELFDLCRGAEPGKLRPIELNFFFSDQLIEIEAGSQSSEGEPVGLSNFVNVVSRDHRAGTGHILDDDVGIAGNIFAEIAGDHARPCVVNATSAVAGDDSNGLVLIERRLRPGPEG